MVEGKKKIMDLWLVPSANQTHIRVTSIHGMLWLQTHFETSDWENISSQKVVLSKSDAEMLANDANQAGLIINSVPSITACSKI